MNIYASAGVVVGIIIGMIACVLIFRFANRNHKMKTEYDERQKELRGRAYQYAFYTLMVYEVIMMILEISEVNLPAEDTLVHFGGVVLGGLVLSGYCIWHDVYWGLNNDRKRYIIIFLLTVALNMIPVIGAVANNSFIENGKLATPAVNVMVIIMLLIVIAELMIKSILDRKKGMEKED